MNLSKTLKLKEAKVPYLNNNLALFSESMCALLDEIKTEDGILLKYSAEYRAVQHSLCMSV